MKFIFLWIFAFILGYFFNENTIIFAISILLHIFLIIKLFKILKTSWEM
jgi:hypothetical protein